MILPHYDVFWVTPKCLQATYDAWARTLLNILLHSLTQRNHASHRDSRYLHEVKADISLFWQLNDLMTVKSTFLCHTLSQIRKNMESKRIKVIRTKTEQFRALRLCLKLWFKTVEPWPFARPEAWRKWKRNSIHKQSPMSCKANTRLTIKEKKVFSTTHVTSLVVLPRLPLLPESNRLTLRWDIVVAPQSALDVSIFRQEKKKSFFDTIFILVCLPKCVCAPVHGVCAIAETHFDNLWLVLLTHVFAQPISKVALFIF